MLYNALLLPHINYYLVTWGYQCKRINILQKRAIRLITLSKYNCHTAPLFKKLKLLTIKDMLALQELKGALYRIWCGVNRLGDSGVKVG